MGDANRTLDGPQDSRKAQRARRLRAASMEAREEARKNMMSMVCGWGNHERCKAGPDRCLCECHD